VSDPLAGIAVLGCGPVQDLVAMQAKRRMNEHRRAQQAITEEELAALRVFAKMLGGIHGGLVPAEDIEQAALEAAYRGAEAWVPASAGRNVKNARLKYLRGWMRMEAFKAVQRAVRTTAKERPFKDPYAHV
jgi:hypothetical protein